MSLLPGNILIQLIKMSHIYFFSPEIELGTAAAPYILCLPLEHFDCNQIHDDIAICWSKITINVDVVTIAVPYPRKHRMYSY